jgi:hypothetical protein
VDAELHRELGCRGVNGVRELLAEGLEAIAGVFGVSLAAWFGFFYALYGTFSPTAPYTGDDQSSLRYVPGALVAAQVAVDPAHPGTVYLGTSEADFTGEGIWKSTNYGNTFTRVDQPFNGPCGSETLAHLNLALAVDDIGYVYTTNNYGCLQTIFRSTDGGVHWTPVFAAIPGVASTDKESFVKALDFAGVELDYLNYQYSLLGSQS